uniref:Uncharacterized protein n=1 Tax=Arundo donax TaxID=35708 RepID=A0A0A9A997_ARUDO
MMLFFLFWCVFSYCLCVLAGGRGGVGIICCWIWIPEISAGVFLLVFLGLFSWSVVLCFGFWVLGGFVSASLFASPEPGERGGGGGRDEVVPLAPLLPQLRHAALPGASSPLGSGVRMAKEVVTVVAAGWLEAASPPPLPSTRSGRRGQGGG